jgi:formate dehydrogenase gamma subunit
MSEVMPEMAKTASQRIEGDQIVRFNVSERIEHFVMMVGFTMLVVTGLPQKFYGISWAANIVMAMGGIDNVRLIHRIFAAIFVIQAFYHTFYVVTGLLKRRFRPSMVPELKDVFDAWHMLKYCLGLASHEPAFGRFTYREKFEYWGVVLGAIIMVVTGAILWFPTWATRVLPGEIIPAAKEAHGGEALLAFLVIVIWHLYGVHLSPLRFPGDISIFTGRLSRKRMIEEHPLEYAELMGVPPSALGELHQEAKSGNGAAVRTLHPTTDGRDAAIPRGADAEGRH